MIERRLVSRPVSTIGTLIAPRVTQQEGPPIVTQGLVGHWDAGNPYSYPGTGTTWTDLAGSSNGTLTNGPTFSANRGGGIVFDGTNDLVNVPNVSAFSLGTAATHECVFRWNGTNQAATICGKWGGSPWREFTIGVWSWNGTDRVGTAGNYLIVTWYLGTSWPILWLEYQLPSAGIYYVQSTHTTTNLTLSVNGVEVKTATYASVPNSQTLTTNAPYGIAKVASQPQYWTGDVHLCRLYNRALSASEITQNFNAFRGRFGL